MQKNIPYSIFLSLAGQLGTCKVDCVHGRSKRSDFKGMFVGDVGHVCALVMLHILVCFELSDGRSACGVNLMVLNICMCAMNYG